MPPEIIFGAGGIGRGDFTNSWDTPKKVSALLDTLQELGITHLDSAALYPPGHAWHTETLLGQAKAAERGFVIDSKIIINMAEKQKYLSDENVESSTLESLRLLGSEKLNIQYAHAPNPAMRASITALAFEKQLKANRCAKIGLCNYNADQMRTYLSECSEKGYTKPTIYQGHYNALERTAEADLLPLLRSHGIKFYAYSPLAGGFLTGKLSVEKEDDKGKDLSRLNRFTGPNAMQHYTSRFEKPTKHAAMRALMKTLEALPESERISPAEASLRWLAWHSALGEGDGIIVGATKVGQVRDSKMWMERGPLEEEVREAVEKLWREGGEMERMGRL